MTADQTAFLTDLYAKSSVLADSANEVSQLSNEASTNSLIILDPTWQTEMGTQLGIWEGMYETSKDIKAPPGLEIVNGKWIELLGHENLAADYYSRGIDQLDSSLINQGTVELNTANSETNELTTLVSDFTAQFD